ncbi:MAG: hypothetical protein M3680_27255 [Myxococcota bacterium]|nr:hypothetical protein [Myxococcota bacterium]
MNFVILGSMVAGVAYLLKQQRGGRPPGQQVQQPQQGQSRQKPLMNDDLMTDADIIEEIVIVGVIEPVPKPFR